MSGKTPPEARVRVRSKQKTVDVIFDPKTFAKLLESVERRNFRSRSEYIRWLVLQDHAGNFLEMSKAFEKLTDHLATGFGSAVAYLAVEIERQQVELSLKRAGR